MTSPGCVRRVSRAAGFAAAALVVAAPAMAASAAPSGPTGSAAAAGSTRGADHGCDPDASRVRAGGTAGLATARLDRAADQRDYTPRDLRRIDRPAGALAATS